MIFGYTQNKDLMRLEEVVRVHISQLDRYSFKYRILPDDSLNGDYESYAHYTTSEAKYLLSGRLEFIYE